MKTSATVADAVPDQPARRAMQRVELRSDAPVVPDVRCWHCGRAVTGVRVARYLYPGDRPRTAIVEDWHACPCGAYQNVRRPTEITVSTLVRT